MGERHRQSWTPERRAALAEAIRRKWQDPDYRQLKTEQLRKVNARPDVRAAASARMRALNERIRADPVLRATAAAAHWRAQSKPETRKTHAKNMREKMKRPDMLAHASRRGRETDHRALAEKRWARHRGGPIPPGFEDLYRELRIKLHDAKAAYQAVILAANRCPAT